MALLLNAECHILLVAGRVLTRVVHAVLHRYLDESLRWLVANGRKKEAVGVLERAARVNNRDLSTVLATLRLHANDGGTVL